MMPAGRSMTLYRHPPSLSAATGLDVASYHHRSNSTA
jgi:hypothetical protein